MKTSELTGAALDWAVAKCEGFTEYDPITEKMLPPRKAYGWVSLCEYHYSTNWAQGGPIIEREFIEFGVSDINPVRYAAKIYVNDKRIIAHGATHLIAGMRAYVASKIGNNIEIPKELK